MVVNAPNIVIPAELQMCVECMHIHRIDFFSYLGWMMISSGHIGAFPWNESPPPREAVQT